MHSPVSCFCYRYNKTASASGSLKSKAVPNTAGGVSISHCDSLPYTAAKKLCRISWSPVFTLFILKKNSLVENASLLVFWGVFNYSKLFPVRRFERLFSNVIFFLYCSLLCMSDICRIT